MKKIQSKNPLPSPANPNIHMYAFCVEVIPYCVVTFVSWVTLIGSQIRYENKLSGLT